MANRWLNQFASTFEKVSVAVYAEITFGASGAPTLVTTSTLPANGASKGVASIAQNSTGNYTITFQDAWIKLLGFSGAWDTSGAAGAAPLGPDIYCTTNGVTSAPGTFRFITGGYAAGAATNPASGERLFLTFFLSNSTAY